MKAEDLQPQICPGRNAEECSLNRKRMTPDRNSKVSEIANMGKYTIFLTDSMRANVC